MPTFILKGNLVHFAAFKKHIGFYPAPTGIEEFQREEEITIKRKTWQPRTFYALRFQTGGPSATLRTGVGAASTM
jgi:hypothetical protein